MMGPKLAELPGTARESDLVRLAFPKARVLQRKDATEANLRRALHGRALLHLATHGLVDETRNGLFSALALTQPEQMTDSDNDGFLQLYEIYELDLSGVELSVLSACQTNVGVHGFSDGVFGLSRGFLAAGARRVIASQWRVDDESTAELVGSFFQLLADHLKNAEAVDYARTLRQAKMKIRRTPRWRSPVYWAPLIILGAR